MVSLTTVMRTTRRAAAPAAATAAPTAAAAAPTTAEPAALELILQRKASLVQQVSLRVVVFA